MKRITQLGSLIPWHLLSYPWNLDRCNIPLETNLHIFFFTEEECTSFNVFSAGIYSRFHSFCQRKHDTEFWCWMLWINLFKLRILFYIAVFASPVIVYLFSTIPQGDRYVVGTDIVFCSYITLHVDSWIWVSSLFTNWAKLFLCWLGESCCRKNELPQTTMVNKYKV